MRFEKDEKIEYNHLENKSAIGIVALPICISLGMIFGTSMGALTKNLPLGICVGAGLGAIFGCLLSVVFILLLRTKVTAVIFDFNGTMIFDEEIQKEAWRGLVREETGREVSDEEFRENVHGKLTSDILEYFLGESVEPDRLAQLCRDKEDIYQDLCLSSDDFVLVSGLRDFLDYLKKVGTPMTIASASTKRGMRFFFNHLDLDKWFELGKVACNDGKIKGKPAPDLFLKAAKNLHVKPENCIVFEDSIAGIEAAKAAGVGKIIKVSSVFSGNADPDIPEIENFYDIDKMIEITKRA